MSLTTDQQIQLLKAVRKAFKTEAYKYYSTSGLCAHIKMQAWACFKLSVSTINYALNAQRLIPLFKRENALQFGARSIGAYWWPSIHKTGTPDPEGQIITPRVAFIDWMISELEKPSALNKLNNYYTTQDGKEENKG